MIRTRIIIFMLSFLALTFVVGKRLVTLENEGSRTDVTVALAYDPDEHSRAAAESREAFTEVLKEEGIPSSWISTRDIFSLETAIMKVRYRAILFPDGMNCNVSEELSEAMRRYADAGGTVAVMYDAGSRDRKNMFMERGAFSSLVGVDYSFLASYSSRRIRLPGTLTFTSYKEARLWDFPPAKFNSQHTLSGYYYGALSYPFVRARIESPDLEVSAHSDRDAILGIRPIGRGTAIWVNLPLGYLKSHGDDLPLRSIVRSIVRRFARMPYLVPVPGGIATLLIDWHVDSRRERRGIPNLLANKILRPDMHMEFDITAGPDNEYIGDGNGLDACGRGRSLVKVLAHYGTIGSHGGWAHNWFAEQLLAGNLTADQVKRLMVRNNRCLEKVTGERVLSYAAPKGIHPQPIMTRILEKLGVTSYYYTGDTGAPPNRTFYNGHMVSRSVWAYPVMTYRRYASLGEMHNGNVTGDVVTKYLMDTKKYLEEQRSAALVYTHPYDLLYAPYAAAFRLFIDDVQKDRAAGTLQTMSMPEYTVFAKRFIETTFSLRYSAQRWYATISNPMGLHAVAFAVPNWLVLSSYDPLLSMRIVERAHGYTIYTIGANVREIDLTLQPRNVGRSDTALYRKSGPFKRRLDVYNST